MTENPYRGTQYEEAWQQGYEAGLENPDGDNSPPAVLTPEAGAVYAEGELAGQEDARQADGGPPGSWANIHEILEGAEGIGTLTEAIAIVSYAEVNPALAAAGEVLEVAASGVNGVLAAVGALILWIYSADFPFRTIRYQGYSYGLVRACSGMESPVPNPGWPDPRDIDNDYSNFYEAVEKAHKMQIVPACVIALC